MRKLAAILALMLGLAPASGAEQTRAALTAGVNAEIVAGIPGGIRASSLNGLLINMIDSFAALASADTISGVKTFTSAPIFPAFSACYLRANGGSPITCENSTIGPPAPLALGGIYQSSGTTGQVVNGVDSSGNLTYVVPTPSNADVLSNTGVSGAVDMTLRAAQNSTWVYPENYGATRSTTTITCDTTAGNVNIACGGGIGDFKVGHYIRLNKAGAAVAVAVPTNLAGVKVGDHTGGVTTYTYSVRAIGADGSVGPVTATINVTNALATLTFANRVSLTWDPPLSGPAPKGYIIYGGSPGTTARLGVSTTPAYVDTGAASSTVTDFLPALSTDPNQASFHIAKITAIVGTTLTLDSAPATTLTGALGSHENARAFNAAFASCSTSGVGCHIPVEGPYLVAEPVNFNVTAVLEGWGSGGTGGPAPLADSRFVWAGGVEPMIYFGLPGSTQVLTGPEIKNITLDGRGVASIGLYAENLVTCTERGLRILGVNYIGFLLTNSPTALTQTRMCQWDTLTIDNVARRQVMAQGIRFDGGVSGPAATTLHRFINTVILTINGDGVYWPAGTGRGQGDGMAWISPWVYVVEGAGGYTFHNAGTDRLQASMSQFLYYPILNAPVCIEGTYHTQPFNIYGADVQNVNNVATTGTNPYQCNGSYMVTTKTGGGRTFGHDRYAGGVLTQSRDDMMDFMEVSGTILRTTQGTWNTAVSGGGTVTAAASGKGVAINTAATLNNDAAIFYPSAAANGPVPSDNPGVVFSTSISSSTAVKVRFGLMGSNADPPTSGIWVEADSSVSTQYRCGSNVGGVGPTYVNAALPAGTAILFNGANINAKWKFDIKEGLGVVSFQIPNAAGTSNSADLWSTVCVMSATLPTNGSFIMGWIKTLDASAKTLTIRGHKFTRDLSQL